MLKHNLLQPMIKVRLEMKGIVGTRETDIIKNMGSGSSIWQTQITSRNYRYATRVYFLFCTANKLHVYLISPVTPKDSTMDTPRHPALDPTADSQQSIDAITVIINPVTLTINTHLLEMLNIRTGCMQIIVLRSTERSQRRQRWPDG